MYKPPRLSWDHLYSKAEAFLDEYNPDRKVPVPIEEIAEFDFDFEIRPLEGIEDDLDVVAFVSWHLDILFIDEFVYQYRRPRARFSVAHELAHCFLHADLYEQVEINSIRDFHKIQEEISADDYSWFEFQANALAGLVLVPRPELKTAFDAAVTEAEDNDLPAAVLLSDRGIQYLIRELAGVFDVSGQCIETCLDRDGLWKPTGGYEA